jgi:hypothetical protein
MGTVSETASVPMMMSEYASPSMMPLLKAAEAITMPTAPLPPSVTAICLAPSRFFNLTTFFTAKQVRPMESTSVTATATESPGM